MIPTSTRRNDNWSLSCTAEHGDSWNCRLCSVCCCIQLRLSQTRLPLSIKFVSAKTLPSIVSRLFMEYRDITPSGYTADPEANPGNGTQQHRNGCWTILPTTQCLHRPTRSSVIGTMCFKICLKNKFLTMKYRNSSIERCTFFTGTIIIGYPNQQWFSYVFEYFLTILFTNLNR